MLKFGMSTTPKYILPYSLHTDKLQRAALHVIPVETRWTGDSTIRAFRWPVVKLGYIDELRYTVKDNKLQVWAKLTPKGTIAFESLSNGLVWAPFTEVPDYPLTIRWYETAFNYGRDGIPDYIFAFISKINHPILLNSSEFIDIRSKLIFYKLRAHCVTNDMGQRIWIDSPNILPRSYISVPLI